MHLILLIIIASAALFGTPTFAQSKITNWQISCGVDKGTLTKKGKTHTFLPSSNHCGTYNAASWFWKQRTELDSHRQKLKTTVKGTYVFETTVALTSNSSRAFDVFQMHDGRQHCAPPLKVEWSSKNQIKLTGEYKMKGGGNDDCIPTTLNHKNYQRGQVLSRNGAPHRLQIALTFDGTGGYAVDVFVDGKPAVSGNYDPDYSPSSGTTIDGRRVKLSGFERSKHFFFKHGVYAAKAFDFRMTSTDMRMARTKR